MKSERAKCILAAITKLESIPEQFDKIDDKITQALELLDEALEKETKALDEAQS